MKKQIIMALSFISSMHACAMPQYIEQLPEGSKIRELYEQQKAHTTDADLLKNLEKFDDVLQQLIEEQRQYDEAKKQNQEDTLKAKEFRIVILALATGLYAEDIFTRNIISAETEILKKREKEFVTQLLVNEMKKLNITE